MTTGNAIYVDAPAVETKAPFTAAMGIEEFVATLADLEAMEPSEAGNAYIAEQILKAMNVVDKDAYNFQKLIDKGLIPGVYFKKFDSEDIFQIKGIGNGFYVAVNATAGDGKTYRMPLEHYITGESLADKYEPCEAPQEYNNKGK
jgi:hypothetical protein